MKRAQTPPSGMTKEAERMEADKLHTSDRPPTAEEEAAAEEDSNGSSDVDRSGVAAHEQEMAERGAHQQGEGKIA